MSAASRHHVDGTDRAIGTGDQGVDQGGFANPGVAHKDASVAPKPGAQRVQFSAGEDHLDRDTERLILGDQRVGRGKIGFGEAEQWLDAGVVSGNQDAVDHPGTWRRVCKRSDDDELIGVGNDGPLVRIVVIGRAA